MAFERLTWVGFMIVAAGWALLFSAPHLGGGSADLAAAGATIDFSAVAQSLIVCGLGIAVIGALQTGFGALNKFFETVALRAQQGRGGAASGPASGGPGRGVARQKAPAPQGPTRRVLERGWVKDRAYVQFADGSVEVDTMLGRRLFPSLKDAQEFIA